MSPGPLPPAKSPIPDRLTARASPALTGAFDVPGDKSISHRALILGALSTGETGIEGLLESDDVLRTAAALRAMGAQFDRLGPTRWRVRGRGVGGLDAPQDVLDFGNSGTGVRLMLGVLTGHPFRALVTGDDSLRSRPMGRVVDPLRQMGLEADLADGGRLPASFRGGHPVLPIAYDVPVPSAQVKSAILLAGLHAPGRTTVVEAVATRDHTERMLRSFGADLQMEKRDTGAHAITVTGEVELEGTVVVVPGDPSSAAFALVAALAVPDSDLQLSDVMLNPGRTGLLLCLKEMGARITSENVRESGGEPVADLRVSAQELTGISVPAERAPSMIDEYPILAVAAAFAKGQSRLNGLAELRVKESDRLEATARGLAACGVPVAIEGDDLIIEGQGPGGVAGGATIDAKGDHRIAMAFLVLGLGAQAPVTVTGCAMIATSFPGFVDQMTALGAIIEPEDRA